jgi:hypothetical protein
MGSNAGSTSAGKEFLPGRSLATIKHQMAPKTAQLKNTPTLALTTVASRALPEAQFRSVGERLPDAKSDVVVMMSFETACSPAVTPWRVATPAASSGRRSAPRLRHRLVGASNVVKKRPARRRSKSHLSREAHEGRTPAPLLFCELTPRQTNPSVINGGYLNRPNTRHGFNYLEGCVYDLTNDRV